MPGDAITILHLSDPQFGTNHVFGKRALPIADGKHDTLLARTLEDLDKLKQSWGLVPDLIVLTGDLAEWGKKEEFQQCFDFLAGIGAHLGIGMEQRHRIAVIPGNHDINRNLAESEYAEWRDDRKGEPFGFRRFEHYAGAFKKFYAKVPASVRPEFTKKQPYTFFQVPEMKVVLAGLNSAMAECHLETEEAKKLLGDQTIYGHHGWSGEDQYLHFARKLGEYERKGWLRIGLVHHNVVRGATTDDENLRDSDDLKKLIGSTLNLLLHGHTHVADRALLPQGQPVLSTGSASLSQAQRPEETPNQYQVLRITANSVQAWMRSFDHHSRRWLPDARVGGEDTPGRLVIPHMFVSVSSTFSSAKALPVVEAAGEPEVQVESVHRISLPELQLREAPHQTSLATIASLRWPGAKLNWHYTNPPFLSVVTNEDFGFRSFVVGLSDSPVLLSEHINQFDQLTDMSTRWERSLVALMSERLESAAWNFLREHASKRGIRLLSWRDFERMSDLRIAVEKQKAELLKSKEYPPDLYISQGMEFFPRPTPGQSADEVKPEPAIADGFTELTKRIERGGPNFFLIDGDFGAGKTFLLRQLALHFSRDGAPVIPLLIELRSLDKVQNSSDMLITRLGRLGQQEIRPPQLAFLAEAGHLLILFDGYDELALRVNFDRAADHLSTITEAAKGKATVVLTCRTQHFKDDHQMVVRLLEQDGLCRARLLPFSQPQIQAFLEKKLGTVEEARERFALIHDIQDLLGLSENPRMLSFIADLPAVDLNTARDAAADGKISAARLYETIIDRWLRNEVRRHSHLQQKDAASGHSAAPTSKSDGKYLAELWEAATHLAFQAWGRMERPFELEEIQQTLRDMPKHLLDTTLAEDERTHGITSGSLLSREGAGAFAFAHYSIPEFLVARELARQLRPQAALPSVFPHEDARKCFSREVITDLMAEFLVDELGWKAAVELGTDIQKRREEDAWGPYDRRNGARLLAVCLKRLEKNGDEAMRTFWHAQMASREPENLAGADLRGRSFAGDHSEAILTGSDLTQANLRASAFCKAQFDQARLVGADLSRCDLRAAQFNGADLSRADLSYADLRRADLTGAILTRATLIGADLREAVLDGSQWDFARLAGATLDDPQLSGLATFGTGLSTSAHPPALLPRASSFRAVAWSPTYDLLAAGHENGSITVWEAASGKLLRTFEGHSDFVLGLAFSPDGIRLASASSDKTLRIWDTTSGKQHRILEGHSSYVLCIAFSPDGNQLVSGSYDNELRVWDAINCTHLSTLEGHSGPIWSVAFSPDGFYLASGSDDKTLRIWEVASGKSLRTLEGHSDSVTSVAFSPNGSRLVSGSQDKTLRLWEVASGKTLFTLEGHSEWVKCVAFSPDGSRLVSGSSDNNLGVWEVATGKNLFVLKGHTSWVLSVAYSPDGTRFVSASGDGTMRLWESGSGTLLRSFQGHANSVFCVAFSPSGRQIVSADQVGRLHTWDTQMGKAINTTAIHEASVYAVAFSPDGSKIASGSKHGPIMISPALGGFPLIGLPGHQGPVRSLAYNAEGSILVSGSDDQTIRLWDAHSGKERFLLGGHANVVWSVALSPDGTLIASGSGDQTLRLWEIETLKEMHIFKGNHKAVYCTTFSPDGKIIAGGSEDGNTRLWDVLNGSELHCLHGHQGAIWSVKFSPDGKQIATGARDNTVRIWLAGTGESVRTLAGHQGPIVSLSFWQEGIGAPLLLVSASTDGTIRVWDADTGECLGILIAHGDGFIALRPDGRYRAVGDMRQYLWHVSGLARYELGELDEVDPHLKLAEDEPLIPPVYFQR